MEEGGLEVIIMHLSAVAGIVLWQIFVAIFHRDPNASTPVLRVLPSVIHKIKAIPQVIFIDPVPRVPDDIVLQ